MANEIRLHLLAFAALKVGKELVTAGRNFNQVLVLVQLVKQLEHQLEWITGVLNLIEVEMCILTPGNMYTFAMYRLDSVARGPNGTVA